MFLLASIASLTVLSSFEEISYECHRNECVKVYVYTENYSDGTTKTVRDDPMFYQNLNGNLPLIIQTDNQPKSSSQQLDNY
jgi:hypothetical protein